MARDLNLAMVLRANTGGATRAIRDLRSTFHDFGTGAASSTDLAAAGLRALTAAAARAAGVIGAALSVRAAARAADAWSDMQSRVGSVMHDMAGAPDMMQRMLDIANRTYSSLSQTVDIYALNTVTLQAMGRSAQDAADFTESLNNMLVVNATKGEEARVVTDALSRAISNGRLDALGFQTIMSRNPRVLQAVADKMGINVNALRAMASQGKVTGDVIVDAVIGALQEVRAEAEDMPATIGDGFLKIGNSVTALVGVIDQALGLSHGIADWLDGISKSIAAMAASDFSGLMEGMANAASLFADALLVLAATRIPAVIGALVTMNVSAVAYAAGMRAGAIATTLMATASRGLAAAMAFVGGPLGLAVAGVTALGIYLWRSHDASQAAAAAAHELDNALRATAEGAALTSEQLARLTTVEVTASIHRQESALRDQLSALKDLGNETQRQEIMATGKLWKNRQYMPMIRELQEGRITTDEFIDRLVALAREFPELNDAFVPLIAAAREIGASQAGLDASRQALEAMAEAARMLEGDVPPAAAGMVVLTEAQQKAADAAAAQIVQLREQANINALIARYGADNLAVTLARHAAERRLFVAQTEAKDITRELKDELVAAWDAANGIAGTNISSGLYAAAGAAGALYDRLAAALGVVRGILAEVGRIGFDTIAVKAETAALRAGKSAAEARFEGELAQTRDRMSRSNLPDWMQAGLLKGKEMAGKELIKAQAERDVELDRRSDKGGGGGGGSSIEDERKRLAELIDEQRRQIATLHETDPVQREIMANHEALAAATAGEAAELRALIAERQRLEKIKSITDEIGAAGREAFTGLAKGASSLADALTSVLDKLADIAASTVWDMFWNGTGGSKGLSGFFSDLVGRAIGGGAPAAAAGGLITGPGGPRDDSIWARVSNGEYVVNAAATAANRMLVEAINAGASPGQLMGVMLAGGAAPRFATGGMVGMAPPPRSAGTSVSLVAPAAPAPVVNIINRSPEPIREDRGAGPDLEGTVTLVVGRAEARGKFDKTRRGRFGLTPELSRR